MFAKCMVIVAVGCFLAAPIFGAETAHEAVVRPGKNTGPYNIGTDPAALVKLLGRPADCDAALGRDCYMWHLPGKHRRVFAYALRDSEGKHYLVKDIRVSAQGFRTPGGNTSRSPFASFWREFPNLKFARFETDADHARIEIYDDVAAGIAIEFAVNPNQPAQRMVRYFTIHEAGQTANPIYYSFGPQ
jgi:hypothetical protein